MPFVSQAQRSFMYANHPGIAKRWESVTPKDHQLPRHEGGGSDSNESPAPKVSRLPKGNGAKRDFRSLSPGQFDRHPGKGSEKESMEEWGTEAHLPDGRAEKMRMGDRHVLDPFAKRDVRVSQLKR